jgi:hypothetical protein
MRVLIACEYSGRVREAFAARGHDSWSCDLRESELPGAHIQADVLSVLDDGWDLMIAHPPCRYLSYAGMAYWNKPGRDEYREDALRFFMQLVNAPIPRWCIENPRGLPNQVYRQPDQVIHPYQFGDPAWKRTCLWLKNLPPLWYSQPGELFSGIGLAPPPPVSIDRSGKKRYFTDSAVRDSFERSRTFPGIANAMAEQWG